MENHNLTLLKRLNLNSVARRGGRNILSWPTIRISYKLTKLRER